MPPRQVDRNIATHIEQALVRIAGVKGAAGDIGQIHLYFQGRAMRARSGMSQFAPRTRSNRTRKALASCVRPWMLSCQGRTPSPHGVLRALPLRRPQRTRWRTGPFAGEPLVSEACENVEREAIAPKSA